MYFGTFLLRPSFLSVYKYFFFILAMTWAFFGFVFEPDFWFYAAVAWPKLFNYYARSFFWQGH